MPQGPSHNEFGTKTGQCYTTDVVHVWLSNYVSMKKS